MYEAFVQGGTEMQRCTVRGCVIPLQCQINNLNPYASYIVEVLSCVPGDNACSSAVKKNFTTLIQCTLMTVHLHFSVMTLSIKFFELKSIILVTAPAALSTSSGAPWSMKVSIRESTETTHVTLYKVSTTGSSCQVSAKATSLACMLEGLSGGSKYTVKAYACVSDSQCSRPITRDGFTLPERKHGQHFPFIYNMVFVIAQVRVQCQLSTFRLPTLQLISRHLRGIPK